MININTNGKGVPFIQQRVLTDTEMLKILNSDKFTGAEKEQVRQFQRNLNKMIIEQGFSKDRLIPMIDSNNKTFIWFD